MKKIVFVIDSKNSQLILQKLNFLIRITKDCKLTTHTHIHTYIYILLIIHISKLFLVTVCSFLIMQDELGLTTEEKLILHT